MEGKGKKIAVTVILSCIVLLAGVIIFSMLSVNKDRKKDDSTKTMSKDDPLPDDPGSSSSSSGKESSSSGKESSSSGKESSSSGKESSSSKNSKGKGGDENADADWTILFYVCGTDLEYVEGGKDIPYASNMFAEMGDADIANSINVLVETGGTRKWRTSQVKGSLWKDIDIPEDSLGRFKVDDKKVEVLDSAPLASMGEASTLSDFIKWGTDHYPAKHYMLVFWNHGYEVPYGCIEMDTLFYRDKSGETYNYYEDKATIEKGNIQNDCLVMDELRTGLENGGIYFDIIGFETCVTASIEFAAAIKDYADYMVASEESAPALGWSHKTMLNYVSKNTDCSPEDFGKNICDSFIKKGAKTVEEYDIEDSGSGNVFTRSTMSLIDLSCMDELLENYYELTKYMYYSSFDVESFTKFQRAAQDTEHFGSDSYGTPALVDLGNYVDNLSSFMDDSKADDNIAKLIKDNIYSVQGSARSKTTGLMFYYPDSSLQTAVEKLYKKTFPDESDAACERAARLIIGNWMDDYVENISFMSEYYWYAAYLDAKLGDSWHADEEIHEKAKNSSEEKPEQAEPVEKDEYELMGTTKINDDNFLELTISKGLEGLVRVDMYVIAALVNDDGVIFVELGETGDIQADFENGIFMDGFDGTWYTLNDDFIPAYVVEETEDKDTYSFPAMLNDERVNILFSRDKKDDSYEILYAYVPSDETGVATRDFRDLKEGDVIKPIYKIIRENYGYEEMPLGEIIYEPGETELDKEEVIGYTDEEAYFYYFTLYDAFGGSYNSDGAFMTFDDGETEYTEIGYDELTEIMKEYIE